MKGFLWYYFLSYFFFLQNKKKKKRKGQVTKEKAVSCLAQLEIPTRGKKKFKMAFAEVPHRRDFSPLSVFFFKTLEIDIFIFS